MKTPISFNSTAFVYSLAYMMGLNIGQFCIYYDLKSREAKVEANISFQSKIKSALISSVFCPFIIIPIENLRETIFESSNLVKNEIKSFWKGIASFYHKNGFVGFWSGYFSLMYRFAPQTVLTLLLSDYLHEVIEKQSNIVK